MASSEAFVISKSCTLRSLLALDTSSLTGSVECVDLVGL